MNIEVILSEQDLSDFLDGNQNYMEAYRAELQHRLAEYSNGSISVEIDGNALVDKFFVDDEPDEQGVVANVMATMVNDWDWLPE